MINNVITLTVTIAHSNMLRRILGDSGYDKKRSRPGESGSAGPRPLHMRLSVTTLLREIWQLNVAALQSNATSPASDGSVAPR